MTFYLISAGIDVWAYVEWDFLADLSEYYTALKSVTLVVNALYVISYFILLFFYIVLSLCSV